MATMERFKTTYPGVIYLIGAAVGRPGTEKIYYIRYRRDGKLVEEKAGRQYQDGMTPGKAAGIRAQRIEGRQASNEEERQKKAEDATRWTIGKLWDEYQASKPNGANRTDVSFWRVYLEKPFAKKEPKELCKLDTDRLRINLLKKRSPQTVRHICALLRRVINYGANQGHVAPLPFKIDLPAVDNIKTEDLSTEELQRLLSVLETTDRKTAATIMKLALFTGMRRGEIFKLRWDDVDFDRGFISIMEPKGGKSQKIPMSKAAREVIKAIPKKTEWIFPARNGGPRKDANKDFNQIKAEAGLPADFRPMHGLRHLYATLLANSGQVDMYTLQKLLTHKSPAMTQRYAHFRDEAMRSAAEKVDDILTASTTPRPAARLKVIK
jgi:integrase